MSPSQRLQPFILIVFFAISYLVLPAGVPASPALVGLYVQPRNQHWYVGSGKQTLRAENNGTDARPFGTLRVAVPAGIAFWSP
jgi:hypothetical protein